MQGCPSDRRSLQPSSCQSGCSAGRSAGSVSRNKHASAPAAIVLKHVHSFMMEYDIHTILDGLSLVATLWVIYEMRFILKNTYQADQDTIQTYYVVRP